MAADDLRTAIGDVRQALLAEHEQGASDAQLLTRFLEQRDEAALAALVRRHAPMVWGVCRRTLRNAADVEDAFQATFLVLVRKAASVRPREMVGNWLYGVARQTALKARATAARRGARERQVARMPEPEAKREVRDDLSSLLDEELSRLPGKYRAVLVLCDLEGQARPAAARQLGLPEGTIASRLARARTMLAKRLARHGLGVTASSLAAALAAEAGVMPPAAVVSAAVRAAWAVASGQVGTAVSAQVGALTERVVKTMLLTQIKKAMAILLALGVAALACGVLAAMRQTPAPPREGGPPAAGDAAPAREKAQRPLPADPLPAGAVAQFGSHRLQDFTIDRSAAFSPDGKLLATSGSNNPICVWDVASGERVRTHANQGSVFDLRWRADGQLAALTFFGHDVFLMQGFGGGAADPSPEDLQRLRQKADERERRPAGAGNAQQEHLYHCFLSADGRLAVAVWNCGPTNRRRARVYRFASGQTSDTAKVECDLAIPDGMNVWLSGDGRWLLAHAQPAGDAPNKLCAFDLAASKDREKPAWELSFPGGYIEASPDSCFSPDGKRVVILFWDDRVELWDGPAGKRLRKLPGLPKYYHQGNAEWRGIDVSADGKRLALITRGDNGEMGGRVVSVETGRDVCRLAPRPLPRSGGSVGSTRFSRDGKRVARVSFGVVGIWDAETGADTCPLPGHRGGVNSLAVLAGGKRVATAGDDQTVRAWEPDTGKETWRTAFPGEMEVKLAIPNGPVVVQARAWGVVGPEGLPALGLDPASGKRRPLPGPLARAKQDNFLACSPDGKRVLTLDRQRPAFRIWSWPAGELQTTATAVPPEKLRLTHCPSAHFTPDGKHFAAVVYCSPANPGLKDRAPERPFVETHDATTGKRGGRTELQPMESPMLLPHASGLYLLGKDAELRDVLSGQLLVKLQAPPGQGLGLEWKRAAALSPDGRTVAVGVGFIGQQLLLFEARTGRYRARLPVPGRSVTGLSFLPDGRLVSLGETATVWSIALQPADGADEDLDREWLRLGEQDPAKAWPAMRKLAGVSAEAVDYIRRRVRPVPKLSDETMRRIIRNLDADEFELREAASKDLDRFGALAVPRVRAVAAGNISLELKRRLTRFLDRHERTELPADELRALRAVEVLEAIGTPAARQVLGELAQGEPDARLTRDAAGAVRRAERR